MITVLGHASRCCEGLLAARVAAPGRVGEPGAEPDRPGPGQVPLAGLRPDDPRHVADPRDPSFGRAKACIVLFMFGAPAHQDIWDLKPDAPAGVRGRVPADRRRRSRASSSASTFPGSRRWPTSTP